MEKPEVIVMLKKMLYLHIMYLIKCEVCKFASQR